MGVPPGISCAASPPPLRVLHLATHLPTSRPRRLREDMGGLRERDADGMTLVTLKPAHGHWMYCTPRVPG
jgi:hypothetical protein